MSTKVFISWSGDLSHRLAESLREWLPGVLQFVRPYFTPEDIEKGARWSSDIAGELESSDIGIICLTKDNTENPWILFEAGALSKSFDKSKVCTLLFGLDTTDLKGPLTIFQHSKFQCDDFKKLVCSVNNAGGDAKLDDAVLNDVFDMWWPKLDRKVKGILADHTNTSPAADRPERDMLEEILELTRLGVRDISGSREVHPELIAELYDAMDRFLNHLSRDVAFSPRVWRIIERPLRRLAESAGHPEMAEHFHFRMRDRMEEYSVRQVTRRETEESSE